MGVNLKGKSFLTLLDFTSDEIRYLLDITRQVKVRNGLEHRPVDSPARHWQLYLRSGPQGQELPSRLLSEKRRHAVFLSKDDIHLGVKEDLKDTARVLGRMFDAIAFRGFKQETVEVLSQWSGVPVYNGLTDLYHPTQILADFMTIEESLGSLKGRKLVFVGDSRNNMANSLMIGSAKMGLHFVACELKALHTDPAIVDKCREIAKVSGAKVEVTEDVETALMDADTVYTDVWASMGEEAKLQERIALLKPYQVNSEMMRKTGKAEHLPSLPPCSQNEVTEDVFESPVSKVFEEAENRKHTIKAVMIATLL